MAFVATEQFFSFDRGLEVLLERMQEQLGRGIRKSSGLSTQVQTFDC